MINLEKVKDFFEDFQIKKIENVNINGEYYYLENKDSKLFINSEFFIANIFSKGSRWGEELFKHLYSVNVEFSDVVENIGNFQGYSIDINLNGDHFENALLIPAVHKSNAEQVEKESSIEKSEKKSKIILRLSKKKLTLDFVEKLGGGSQLLLSENMPVEVDIIDFYKNKVIGKGILEKISDGYKLKIVEVSS